MLEVSKLSRAYGDFLAVDAVSFQIGSGEIVGLLGHNGAGKTTIMKMLSGFLEPDQGSISVDGLDLARHTKEVQRVLGYLPENLPVYPEMSVADFLDYAAVLKGLGGDLRKAEIRRVVRATDIADKLLAPIATLSRGYKQRVGVAQAILGRPRLLILDEPTNGLDPTQTEHMRQLIRELASGATVILSTHIMQEVDALCDRVLIVSNGRLKVDERLAELKQSSELALLTDLPPARLRSLLPELPGASVQSDPAASMGETWHAYRVSVGSEADMHESAHALAVAVFKAGGKLAGLRPLVRNLESLFRDVSEQPEATNNVEDSPHVA